MGHSRKVNLQDWIKYHVTEKQNAFDEDEAHTDCESTPTILSTMEEVVVYNARLSEPPLVNAKDDENNKADNQRSQDWCSIPCKDATTKIESCQK